MSEPPAFVGQAATPIGSAVFASGHRRDRPAGWTGCCPFAIATASLYEAEPTDYAKQKEPIR
jgi:hypothetical protein